MIYDSTYYSVLKCYFQTNLVIIDWMMDSAISFKCDSNCHKDRGRLRNMSQWITHVPILYIIVVSSKLKPMK